jgi:hypothetical protein
MERSLLRDRLSKFSDSQLIALEFTYDRPLARQRFKVISGKVVLTYEWPVITGVLAPIRTNGLCTSGGGDS